MSIASFLGYGLFGKGDLAWRTGPQNGYGLTTLSMLFGLMVLVAVGSAWTTYTEWRDSDRGGETRPRRKRRGYWR